MEDEISVNNNQMDAATTATAIELLSKFGMRGENQQAQSEMQRQALMEQSLEALANEPLL